MPEQNDIKLGKFEVDAWIFTFITRGSYLIVDYEIGKRKKGHDDYTKTIPEYYAESCVYYGQLIKIKQFESIYVSCFLF